VKLNYAVVVGDQYPIIKTLSQKLQNAGWTAIEVIAATEQTEDLNYLDCGCFSEGTVSFNPWYEQSIEEMLEQLKTVTTRIDMVVTCFNYYKESHLRGSIEANEMMKMYEANTLVLLRTIEIMLPLMVEGMKKIVIVTDVKARMVKGMGNGRIGYDMSLAARDMSVKIMSNALQSEGYTFQLIEGDLEDDTICQQL